MKFFTIRDLRNRPTEMCKKIAKDEVAIVTNKGKPTMLVVAVTEENFEIMLQTIKQAQTMVSTEEKK